ncbi:uncharacterized protein FSUBG_2431 [Fusarium subglutinans]|uniref:Uncharacterized protein n=1 Tax=Gibberella subglutinans TaxID=42677 RepID=A0A8H5V5G8_GIBSU|nr:uncharacterized protein FSUBG_2431 [Fusarium subglutinans]KAF5611326.1 hypothetical protein FSUBG_2431 [Fusarium subglutinans]
MLYPLLRNGEESGLRHPQHFAFAITSGLNRKVIYREEEHENIDEIFPKDYGTTQINLIDSLAIFLSSMRCVFFPTGSTSIEENERYETVLSVWRIYSTPSTNPVEWVGRGDVIFKVLRHW